MEHPKHNAPFEIKHLFSSLQDEISRIIFTSRLQYFLSEDDRHLRYMLKSIGHMGEKDRQTIMDLIEDETSQEREIILYGAGYNSKCALGVLKEAGIQASLICDSDQSKQGTLCHGLQIISPKELVKNHSDALVVISTASYFEEILQRLMDMGFSQKQIYVPGNYNEQYFGESFLRPVENEVFVDLGVYDGYTIKRFVHFCNNRYKTIYGLEPDPVNWQSIKDWVEENKTLANINLIQKGAWSSNAALSFDSNAQGSHVIDSGTYKVDVMPVDELVKDDAVTLIKMDIEGAELEALYGAQKTIQKNKPRLAISVYHKPDDILTIPLYIHSLAPEYRFYLRHYSFGYSYFETILYAVL